MYTPGTIANAQTERAPTETKMGLLAKYIKFLVELGIL